MILIDDRKGSAELAPMLSTKTILCSLEFADFAWAGNGPDGPVNVGVERKTIGDLVQSMVSGRLQGHQMQGLNDEYDRVYLLVEGIWRPDPRSGILQLFDGRRWRDYSRGRRKHTAAAIYRFINRMVIAYGMIPVYSCKAVESAMWLDAVHGWWSRKWEQHDIYQAHEPPAPAQFTKPNLVARVANAFDGVRWKRAREIGKCFRTPGEFIAADEGELVKVKGVGKVIAKSIISQRGGG